MYTYFTKEEKGKQVLLFLHGWGCDGSVFAPVIYNLSGVTAICVDLWGFGKSQRLNKAWGVVDYCNELKNFCDANGLANFCIVAHSFGGRVALAFASKYPSLVNKLVITGGAGLRRLSIKRAFKVACFKALKLLKKWRLYKGKLPSGSADYRVLDDVMKQTFVKVVRQDLSHYARQIVCPTLLIWGKNDTETPMWMAKKFNRLIKGSALVTLQGGHFAFLQQPVAFAMIVDSFLED